MVKRILWSLLCVFAQACELPDADVNAADATSIDGSFEGSDAGLLASPDASEALLIIEYPIGALSAMATQETVEVAWIQRGQLWLQRYTPDGVALDAAHSLGPIEANAELATLVVDGVPWLADGHADRAIRIRATDRPDFTMELALTGIPKLAASDDHLLVVGRAQDDYLGWVRLHPELYEPEPPTLAPMDLPSPDSVVGISTAVVLRFNAQGQCLHLDAVGHPLYHYPCLSDGGRLITDGELGTLAVIEDERVWMTSMIDAGDERFMTVSLDPADPASDLELPSVGGEWPVLGRDPREPTERQLLILGVQDVWKSLEAGAFWDDIEVRAVVRWDEHALVLSAEEGTLTVIRVELEHRVNPIDADAPLYDFTLACDGMPERCNGVDDDCDGEIDDGICCERGTADEGEMELHHAPRQMLMSTVNGYTAQIIAFREREDRWSGWFSSRFGASQLGVCTDDQQCTWGYECQLSDEGRNRGYQVCTDQRTSAESRRAEFRGAYHGYAFIALNQFIGLVADDVNGQPTVFWASGFGGLPRYTRDGERNGSHPRSKGQVPIPCDRILAVEQFHNEEGTSLLGVICPDKFIQMSPAANVPDLTWTFEELGLEPASWVTITQMASSVSRVLIGSENEGVWSLTPLVWVVGQQPRNRPLTPALAALTESPSAGLRFPIYQHVESGVNKPLVQIREEADGSEVRVFRYVDHEFEWQTIDIGGPAQQVSYAAGAQKIYLSAPTDEGLGIWTVDLSGWNLLDLWPPANLTLPDGALWQTSQSQDTLISFTPESESTQHLVRRTVQCEAR